jgi:asparagine synthase (glutamine-hydrolysing)
VRRLPGAHLLRWRDGTVAVERWWRPRAVSVPGRYRDAVAALRELLVDSVRLRMRSDVPLGTSLSGGVDSSAVAALVGRLGSDDGRHAFTARFPGYERDEWSYAATAAAAAGVETHHAIEPTAADALRDLDALVRDEEEPVASLSVYAQWRVNAAAREAGVTVLLDGQGGDELFGGYPFATGFALRASSPRARAAALADAPLATTSAIVRSLGADHLPAALRRRYQRRLASPYAAPAGVAPPRLEPWMRSGGPLHRELVAETFVTSLPQLLRYADRSSMAHSREVRLPLLDRRVAELALSLPADYLRPRGVAKGILRDSVADLVPRELLARRDKVGFEPPQQRWLETTAFRDRIGEVLLDPRARARGLYDGDAIEADLRTEHWRAPAAIWRALNAELWLTGLVEDRPSASPSRAAGSPTRI